MDLPLPTIRPLTESDIDEIVINAGGARAHPDADRRGNVGADYVLGDAVIELKTFDEDALSKPEHQARIATLFKKFQPDRPVVVIDPRLLPQLARREYASILERPVRTAVAKAREQLKQSRSELTDASLTVLLFINNGYLALSQEELLEYAERRARNQSSEIDGVAVGGCYFHSDGFDTVALWPLEYRRLRGDTPFLQFDALREAWSNFSNKHMTEFVRGVHGPDAAKRPDADITFNVDEITYVKPAKPFGSPSKFFVSGRPRANTPDYSALPSVAQTIPTMTRTEHRRIGAALCHEPLLASFETWSRHVEEAKAESSALMPTVPIEVTRGAWEAWSKRNSGELELTNLRRFANARFNQAAANILRASSEMSEKIAPPGRYIAVGTEIIGQDAANDLSHISIVTHGKNGSRSVRALVSNARVPHEHALSLASAYAVLHGVQAVFWQKDLRFAWT